MINGKVVKDFDSNEVTEDQLKKINIYTRRKLLPDELFVFPVILCDNQIDRDFEKFSDEALDKLCELFVGKTGIFDHNATAENQAARIFDTEIVVTEKSGSYKCLRAYVYMVRCSKNNDLILEIEAGIKKEISIGCAVDKIICSVCGNNQKNKPCGHRKGKEYNGVDCHYILDLPTDAYEWSFVAVPAQKNAGVTKIYEGKLEADVLKKLNQANDSLTLSVDELWQLKSFLGEKNELIDAGQVYVESLQQELVRNAMISQPQLSSTVLEDVSKNMTLLQLKEFHKSFAVQAEKKRAPLPQLAKGSVSNDEPSQFKI